MVSVNDLESLIPHAHAGPAMCNASKVAYVYVSPGLHIKRERGS